MYGLRPLLLLSVAVVAAGCGSSPPPPVPPPPVPPEWQTIVAGTAFTFRAPPDLKPVPVQGRDSLVGKYTSPSLDVSFDYGRYSNPLDGYAGRWVTVDGRRARLVSRADIVSIHFPKVTGKTRLTMSVRLKGADPKVAETMLRSIDFPFAE